MSVPAPGRNDPCPCGSGRKFKHCCLAARTAEDSARVRLRSAEGRVVDELLRFTLETWGKPLMIHAWEDFWNYQNVPEDMPSTLEFESMFIPWLVFGFVPDAEIDGADPDWPSQPIGLHWLSTTSDDVPDLDRLYVETACRSPMSVLAVEHAAPGRSLDLKDVLTGARFRVLEQSASQKLKPADLVFARVVTVDGVGIMLGIAPYIVPPRWHTHIIDWREHIFRKRKVTCDALLDADIEIRELYFEIAGELANPTPPRLSNTDGDPLALTTLTFELKTTVGDAVEKLASLANIGGDDHIDEIVRDTSGEVTRATFNWIKAGNRKLKEWDNTILGHLRLEAGRLVADVNSARRADRLKREVAKRLGKAATLIDTSVVDPGEALKERARQGKTGRRHEEPAIEQSAEIQAIQEEMARAHWERWLDTRVPALGNKTPRQAARTAKGRERLEALLAQFDRDAEGGPPSMAAHLATIREALALTK